MSVAESMVASAPDAPPPDTMAGFVPEAMDRVGPGWDGIVSQFADACMEQSAGIAGARWDPSRLSGLLLRHAATGETEAAALAVVIALPMVRAGLAYFKFGPLWRRKDKPARPGVLGAMLEAVKREFALARGLLVRVMPPADPGHEATWRNALAAAGFQKHREVAHPERYLVDLRLSADAQMTSLNAKWRANLMKAQRAGVEVREVDPRHSLDEFMALYRAMAARKRFDDRHGVEHLHTVLAAESAPPLRMFFASHGGETVAGSVVIGSGERLSVPFSATGPRALDLRAGYAMRWALMDRLRGSGAHWLDLGGHEGDDGLRHFKEGNVGKRGVTLALPGEYDFCTSRTSAAATSAIELARTALDNPALRGLLHGRSPAG